MNSMLAATVYCIVGCNAGSPEREALHVLECDTETGAAKIVQTVKGPEGTTCLGIDRARKGLCPPAGDAIPCWRPLCFKFM